MNARILPFCLMSLMSILVLNGCASARLQPPEVEPRGEVVSRLPDVSATENEILAAAAARPAAPLEGEWKTLFDGKSLADWCETEFEQDGKVELFQNLMVFRRGDPFVGVNYKHTNEIPKVNYEVAFEAMRVSGGDFFCGFTFPVKDSFCSLILGGWGGSVVGISCVDGADASENETTTFISFETGKWYQVRVRVSERKLEAWVEQKKIVDLLTPGRQLAVRFGDIELSKPFGFASWTTSAAFRNIKIREVDGPVDRGG